MITAADFFYLVTAICFVVLTTFAVYTLYQVAQTIKEIKEFVLDIKATKDTMKIGVLSLIQGILGKARKVVM